MVYGLKRIEDIVKDDVFVIEVYKLIHEKQIANIDNNLPLKWKLTDLMHSDYGIYLYHTQSNSIVITLGNGEELNNNNYISQLIQFTVSGTKLNISIGCGTLTIDDNSDELIKYDMISAITISIDIGMIDIIEDIWDTHSSDNTIVHTTYNNLKNTFGEYNVN